MPHGPRRDRLIWPWISSPSHTPRSPTDSGALYPPVGDVGPIPRADGEVLAERPAGRTVDRHRVRPVERAHAAGDQPAALAPLEPVDIAKADNHVALVAQVVGDAVGVDLGDVAVDPDERRPDEVHRRLEMRQDLEHPPREVAAVAPERVVVVEPVRVI